MGNAPAPNELHAALRQMSLGKAAGEDEVTAGLLKFGGSNLWEATVKVCREQWLLLTEAAPGAEVVGLTSGVLVSLFPRGTRRTRIPGEVSLFYLWDPSFWRGLWQLGLGRGSMDT